MTTSTTKSIDGTTVEWIDLGNGPTTLFLHAGCFGAWFEPVVGLVSGRRIDLRRAGYTGRDAPDTLVSIEEHAAHAAAVLQTLAAAPATVVAHSSGCVIAVQLALDHSDLVTRLVLSEPPLIAPFLDPSDPPEELEPVGALIGGAVVAAAAGDIGRAMDLFLGAVCGPDHNERITAALGPSWRQRAEQDATFFFTNELRALGAWTRPDLRRLGMPTQFVQGSASPSLTRRLVARLAASVPRAEVATVDGANHLLPLTHPHELARLIDHSAR